MYLLTSYYDNEIENKTFASPHYAILEALKIFRDDLSDAYQEYDDDKEFCDHLHNINQLVEELGNKQIANLFPHLSNYEFHQDGFNENMFSLKKAYDYAISITKKNDTYQVNAWSNLHDGHLELRVLPISELEHDNRN